MAFECIVVMPVYNEAGGIGEVCRDWLNELHSRRHLLLVVDDGSSDGTDRILNRLASECDGLMVIRKPNGGHGSAVLHGYREALRLGCEWVFQVDSDGQFRASDFDVLWSRRHLSGFILGDRTERADPRYRRALSSVHRLLLLLLFKRCPKDPNIPYRLMRASLLERMLESLPGSLFAPNVFLAILAARSGQPALDLQVQHLARTQGNSSIRLSRMVRVASICLVELLRFRMAGFRTFDRPGHVSIPNEPPGNVTPGRT